MALLVWKLLPWMERIPESLLAAIVIHAVGHTLNSGALRPYFAWRRDRVVAVVAFVAVIFLGVLDGLLAAMAVSVLMLLQRLADARVSWLGQLPQSHDYVDTARHPEARVVPGVLIGRPEEPLFFGNADAICARLLAQVAEQPGLRAVVLSLEESPDLDSTALEALTELAAQLHQRGLQLRLARVKDRLRELLQRVQIPTLAPGGYAAWSVDDAVAALTGDFAE